MKKYTWLTSIFLIISCTSCYKKHSCYCDDKYQRDHDGIIIKGLKSHAEKKCAEYEVQNKKIEPSSYCYLSY